MEQWNGFLEGDLRRELQRKINADNRSVRALAREAGVPRSSLRRFLKDETGITLAVAEALYETIGLGPDFLEDAKAIHNQTEVLVAQSQSGIHVIGSREVNSCYLANIAEAASRGVPYNRLVPGKPTQQLTDHLSEVESLSTVEIRYAPQGDFQYQNLSIIDDVVIAMLGEVYTKSQTAMQFTGRIYRDQYMQYFDRAFSSGKQFRTDTSLYLQTVVNRT